MAVGATVALLVMPKAAALVPTRYRGRYRPTFAGGFPAILLALALAGCGGSSNSPDPVMAPLALPDTFTASTATTQVLDVLVNDRDPAGGALTIVSVEGSGQPTLSIQDGARILYQPACCSTTSDVFRYTVRNAAGAMASAEVRITVRVRISLAIRAPSLQSITQASVRIGTEAPLPVTITGDVATVVVDARVDPALLTAQLAENPRLALFSVVAGIPQLLQRTPADGRLDADRFAPLELNPFTTSLAGTVQADNDGSLPTTQPAWDARIAALTDWEGVTRRAQFLAAVLRAGESALPPGATLIGLAGDPSRTELLAEESGLPLRPRNEFFPASASSPFVLALGGNPSGSIWMYRGGSHLDELAIKLELAADGTGILIGPRGAFPISWDNLQQSLNVRRQVTGAMFDSGLLARRGGVCDLSSPNVFPWTDRVSITSARFASLVYAGGNETLIASVTGTQVTGFSPSGCNPFISEADPGPAFPLRAWLLVPRPIPGLAFSAGRWVIPAFDPATMNLERPIPHALAEVRDDGSGTGPGAAPFTSRVEADGSLTIEYPDGSSERLYAVARFGSAFRVLAEIRRATGERQVDEAWIAKLDDPIDFSARLRNVRLRGCCRIGQLRVPRFDAQGIAYFDDLGTAPVLANIGVAAPRGTLTIPARPAGPVPTNLIVEPVASLDDGRFLTFSRFQDEVLGSAEIVTLEPVP